MVDVSPSILAADFTELGNQCEACLLADSHFLHIDVMDGHFVPNISLGVPVLASLSRCLPGAIYDVHLMISHPLNYVQPFVKAGARILTFHIESCDDPQTVIDAIHAAGCKAGLSVKPGTPIEAVYPYLDELELVLVMSVEPGFGGQKFMPAAVDKIAAVRAECDRRGLSPWIEVDGGIDLKTAPLCTAAGANLLVAGSSVFRAPNQMSIKESIRLLKNC